MDMHLRVWSLNYRHPSRAEAYALTLLSLALQEPVLPQWPLPGGVADFAIPTAGIILEIDDKGHSAKWEKDIVRRGKWMASGWLVISCDDKPEGIAKAVAHIAKLISALPKLETTMDSEQILGGRVVLRGDYYRGMAEKRAAKKLKASKQQASKQPKAPAKVSRKRSPAAKPAAG